MRYPLDQIRIREMQFGAYNPISNTFGNVRSGGRRPHQGWDLEAAVGTPVYSIAAGTLTTGVMNGYGRYSLLEFQHNGRTLWAFYGHLSEQTLRNMSVVEGAVIARTGIDGNAASIPIAEAHLHFEIWTARNPGRGLNNRIDPGEIFGYEAYASRLTPLDGRTVRGILQ